MLKSKALPPLRKSPADTTPSSHIVFTTPTTQKASEMKSLAKIMDTLSKTLYTHCKSGDWQAFSSTLRNILDHPKLTSEKKTAIINQQQIIITKSRSTYRYTALQIAIANSHEKIALTLISLSDINVNATDFDGTTALLLALETKQDYIVKELLKNKFIDVNIPRVQSFRIDNMPIVEAAQSGILSPKVFFDFAKQSLNQLYQESEAQYFQVLQIMINKISLSSTDRYGRKIIGYFHEHGQDYLTALNLIAATKPSSPTEVIEWSHSFEEVSTDDANTSPSDDQESSESSATDEADSLLSDDLESSESPALEGLSPHRSSVHIPVTQSTLSQPNSPFDSPQSPSLFAPLSFGSPMLLATPSPKAQVSPTRLSSPQEPLPLSSLSSQRSILRTSTTSPRTNPPQDEHSKLNLPSALCQDNENDDRQQHKPLLDDEVSICPDGLLDDDSDVVTLRF